MENVKLIDLMETLSKHDKSKWTLFNYADISTYPINGRVIIDQNHNKLIAWHHNGSRVKFTPVTSTLGADGDIVEFNNDWACFNSKTLYEIIAWKYLPEF